MKKILFLYNPIAGQAKITRKMNEIVAFYEKYDCLVTLCTSQKLATVYENTPDFANAYDTIVCSGGDGTLNMVATFLMEHKVTVPIGYLPAGSTNDYASSIGIPKSTLGALKKTVAGKRKNMDIGMFNDKCFLYVAAFGAFTKASYSTPQKTKNVLGHTAYVLEGIREISDIKASHMKIVTGNGTMEGDFMLGMITNSRSVGGFKNLLPKKVDMGDGMLEVMLVKMPRNIMEFQEIAFALLGKGPAKNPHIHCIQTSHVEFISEEPVAWTLDGEYGGAIEKATITDIPQAFTIWG